MTTSMTTRANPHAKQWQQFQANTQQHQLTVIRDEGLYRHLRMAMPGTGIWSWQVVTWPGYLWIGGDIGCGYTFQRDSDMLAWADTRGYGFCSDGAPFINPGYWAEKLTTACRDAAVGFSEEQLRETITQHGEDLGVDVSEALEEVEYTYSPDRAYGLLTDLGCSDVTDSDWTDWDHHYLLACYALATTTRAYWEQAQ